MFNFFMGIVVGGIGIHQLEKNRQFKYSVKSQIMQFFDLPQREETFESKCNECRVKFLGPDSKQPVDSDSTKLIQYLNQPFIVESVKNCVKEKVSKGRFRDTIMLCADLNICGTMPQLTRNDVKLNLNQHQDQVKLLRQIFPDGSKLSYRTNDYNGYLEYEINPSLFNQPSSNSNK